MEINISHQVNGQEESVLISYKVEMNADIQLITCMVNPGSHNAPPWLGIRKFELKSILSKQGYVPLYTDNENIRNTNAILFIDKAYTDIMAREKFRMA